MMIYLASPYSSPEPEVRSKRYWDTVKAVAALTPRHPSHFIYSPIVHHHVVALESNLPKDALYWQQVNKIALYKADQLWILRLTGWHVSKGVVMELGWARAAGKPIMHIEPPEYGFVSSGTKAGKLA